MPHTGVVQRSPGSQIHDGSLKGALRARLKPAIRGQQRLLLEHTASTCVIRRFPGTPERTVTLEGVVIKNNCTTYAISGPDEKSKSNERFSREPAADAHTEKLGLSTAFLSMHPVA